MSAGLLSRSDDDAPTFSEVREYIQGDIFARLTERIDRLHWDAARLREWQRDRLRALLAQVTQRSAFHASRLRGVDPARFELADLDSLPVMTKAQMMADFDDVVTDKRMNRAATERALAATSTEPVPLPGGHLCMATGGSSGQRGIFGYDPAAAAEFVTMIFRTRIALMAAAAPGDGQRPGDGLGRIVVPARIPDSTIAMVGAPSAVHGTMFVPSLLAGSPISFVHVPVTLPIAEMVGHLNELQPDALFGYPSMLARLAAEQQAGRLSIGPRLVNSTAETLLPAFRAAISAAFGAPIMNTFATSEGLVGASWPGEEVITLATDGCIVELVDACNQPVQAGTPSAKVLVTNLYNVLQPLIRYELGDSFAQQPDSTAHGHMGVIVEGRADEILRYAEVDVHPLVLRTVLLTTPEILDYQATQTARGVRVSVLLERPADLDLVTGSMRAALVRAGLADPDVTVEAVSSLPRHPETGKLRRVISA
jgi:phenylacetate-CoA ligase